MNRKKYESGMQLEKGAQKLRYSTKYFQGYKLAWKTAFEKKCYKRFLLLGRFKVSLLASGQFRVSFSASGTV